MRLFVTLLLSGCPATDPGSSMPAAPSPRAIDAAPAAAAPATAAPVGFSSVPDDAAQATEIPDDRIRDAIAKGVPMLMYRAGPEDAFPPRPALVRAGVWVQETRRFVPLAPVVPRSLGAIVEGPRVVVVTGEDLVPGGITNIARARVVTFGAPAVEPDATQTLRSDDVFIEPEVVPTATGARLRIADFPAGAWPWRDLDATGLHRAASQAAPDRPWLKVTVMGTLLVVPPPAGFEVRATTLERPGGDPIELGRGHGASRWRSVVVAGDTAVVASVRSDCIDGERGLVHHFVDRVDLAAGTVTRLAEGDGAAAIRLGPDGALYLQTGVHVRRFETPTAVDGEDLPEGFVLATPLHVPSCDA